MTLLSPLGEGNSVVKEEVNKQFHLLTQEVYDLKYMRFVWSRGSHRLCGTIPGGVTGQEYMPNSSAASTMARIFSGGTSGRTVCTEDSM